MKPFRLTHLLSLRDAEPGTQVFIQLFTGSGRHATHETKELGNA